jgi:hypothetical protein
MIYNNPNLLALASKLELIPGVLQVRFWKPLRQKLKDIAGENSINFVLVTNSFDPNLDYQFLRTIIPAEIINDLDLHDPAVANLTDLVNDYLQTGIVPTRLLESTPPDPIGHILTTASILESYTPEPVTPTIGEAPPTP